MTIPIVRMYETNKAARDAVAKLRDEGFTSDQIFLLTPASKGYANSIDPFSIARKAGFFAGREAFVYSDALQEGRSLVSIQAPFGYGRLATEILDGFGPVETGLERPSGPSIAWEEGAPLSSAIRLPPLLRNTPAPFSTIFSLGTLSRGRTFRSPRFKELGNSDFALFGSARLSRNPSPLSSIFHLKTISVKGGSSWTRSFGLPMLSQNAAPLSSMLGLHAVTERLPRHHPAPFSAHIGMPPLSRGRSFLSRMFPALTNPRFALFGRNPIISSPAPLSSLFGMKTLKERSAPWEKSFGWPLLMKKGRPTSLGLPLLSRNPAPLSSLFGLRVLSIFQ